MSLAVNQGLAVEPAIASETLASRNKISNIAGRDNAIVAINGGYFKPQTGVPLGTLMINKKVYTGPIYDRVAMGIFDIGFEMARVQLKANVVTNKGGLKIDNINQPFPECPCVILIFIFLICSAVVCTVYTAGTRNKINFLY